MSLLLIKIQKTNALKSMMLKLSLPFTLDLGLAEQSDFNGPPGYT